MIGHESLTDAKKRLGLMSLMLCSIRWPLGIITAWIVIPAAAFLLAAGLGLWNPRLLPFVHLWLLVPIIFLFSYALAVAEIAAETIGESAKPLLGRIRVNFLVGFVFFFYLATLQFEENKDEAFGWAFAILLLVSYCFCVPYVFWKPQNAAYRRAGRR